MRIISKFTDYYDSIQGMGIDLTDVYERVRMIHLCTPSESLSEVVNDLPYDMGHIYSNGNRLLEYRLTPIILSVCGECRLLFEVEIPSKDVLTWLYSPDEVGDIVGKWSSIIDNNYSSDFGWGFSQRRVANAFETVSKLDLTEYHHEFCTPVLTVVHPELTVSRHHRENKIQVRSDASLVELGFARQVDPYTAYQQIAMYRNGVLASSKDGTHNINDVDMRDSKGFDDRSFKTQSPGKKRNKRNKSK